MKGAEQLREGLRYARRIGDAVLMSMFLVPGLGIVLSPLVLVTYVALLPRQDFREWLKQFDRRPQRFEWAQVSGAGRAHRFHKAVHHYARRR